MKVAHYWQIAPLNEKATKYLSQTVSVIADTNVLS